MADRTYSEAVTMASLTTTELTRSAHHPYTRSPSWSSRRSQTVRLESDDDGSSTMRFMNNDSTQHTGRINDPIKPLVRQVPPKPSIGRLREPSLPTIYYLLHRFSGGGVWWGRYEDVRLTLVDYIAPQAHRKLGLHHPLSRVLSLLSQTAMQTAFMPQMLRLLAENTSAGVREAKQQLLTFQLGLIPKVYSEMGASELAANEITRLSKEIDASDPGSNVLLQQAEHKIARVYYDQNQELDAERACLEVLRLCVEATGRENDSHPATASCLYLGRVYQSRGKNLAAERYLRLALEGALRGGGPDNVGTRPCVEQFSIFLEGLGRHDEAAQLHEQYAAVESALDGYYLDQNVEKQV